jgi:hypothetical protein
VTPSARKIRPLRLPENRRLWPRPIGMPLKETANAAAAHRRPNPALPRIAPPSSRERSLLEENISWV